MNLRVAIFATDRLVQSMEHDINTWLEHQPDGTTIEDVVFAATASTVVTQIYYAPPPARQARLRHAQTYEQYLAALAPAQESPS